MNISNLENRMTVGAVALYDALTEEPTAEEEEAMDELERRRTAHAYEAEVTKRLNETPRGLIETSIEVLADLRDRGDTEFALLWHDAAKRDDENLIGKLFLRARDRYIARLAAEEVGLS